MGICAFPSVANLYAPLRWSWRHYRSPQRAKNNIFAA